MKRPLMWGLGLLALGGIAWGIMSAMRGQDATNGSQERRVEAVVERRDFVSNVLATGTIRPKVGARVNVGARTSGKVDKLNVEVGDSVVRGQVLAVIEHVDLEAQVKQKVAQIEATRTQILAEKSRAVADQARLAANLEQRKADLHVELRRLASVREQRQSALDTERQRMAAVREQRSGELSVAHAQSLESLAALDFVRKDMKRMKELFDKGMLPEQSLDKASTDLTTTEWRLKSMRGQQSLAQARLEQEVALQGTNVKFAEVALANDVIIQEETVRRAEASVVVAEREIDAATAATAANVMVLESTIPRLAAELEEMQTRLGYASVTAPIDGVVGSVSTQEGETVAAGFNAPMFVTVVDLTQLQVDAFVDEVDIGKVAAGQAATFVVDAFPDTVFEGKVRTIYPSAILQDNVVYYDVVIDISSDFSGKLRPEMTANVTIEVAASKDVLAVPLRSVRRTAGTALVTVAGSGGEEAREVVAGLEDGDFTEIRSGLQEGEKVVYTEKESRKQEGGPR